MPCQAATPADLTGNHKEAVPFSGVGSKHVAFKFYFFSIKFVSWPHWFQRVNLFFCQIFCLLICNLFRFYMNVFCKQILSMYFYTVYCFCKCYLNKDEQNHVLWVHSPIYLIAIVLVKTLFYGPLSFIKISRESNQFRTSSWKSLERNILEKL